MERKKKNAESFIEPMPRQQFLDLMKEFKASGGKYIANEESEAFLDTQGAEACTLNENTILFRRKPSRAAVYEELYHVKQFREGRIEGSTSNAIECEIEAKLYLLSNAKTLELTENEILQTREDLERYKRQLNDLKGDEI